MVSQMICQYTSPHRYAFISCTSCKESIKEEKGACEEKSFNKVREGGLIKHVGKKR